MEDLGRIAFSSYKGGTKDRRIAIARAPRGWFTKAERLDEYQSRDRPFKLKIQTVRRQDGSGPRMVADTGEAFSWFDRATMTESMAMSNPMMGMGGLGMLGMGGLMGMPFGFPSPSPLPSGPGQMLVTAPRTGRPERPFMSHADYLDGIVASMDNGFLARNQIWLLGEAVVGETPAEMSAREARLAEKEAKEWIDAGVDGLDVRVNAYLDRTVVRHWKIVDAEGQLTHILVGAKLKGHDKLIYKSGRAPSSMLGSAPFGHAQRGDALYYDVEWMAETRFYGFVCEGDMDIDEFRRLVVNFGGSVEFDKSMMDEMKKESERLAHADHEEAARENAALHQYNQEFGERMRQRDIERQQRMRDHEAKMRSDRARRQAWDDKMARDRQVRHAWSDAIRGTEQYRDPYGHMVEVRVTGPNQRAFYDHMTGRTIMSDITDVDKPVDWEELPRWQW